MLRANRCPFLRTVVWISDSKLLQFINFEYYAFEFHQSILEDISCKNVHQPRKISKPNF